MTILFHSNAFAKEWVYYVTNGDNLWDISKKYLKSPSYFKQVQSINNVLYPKKLAPGTRIRIPLEWVKIFAADVQLISLNGKALKVQKSQTSPAKALDVFTLGDELEVLAHSTATIRFADNTEMTIYGPATVGFDQLQHYGETGMVDTSVRLKDGKLEIRAEKAKGAGSRLDITTASAITSVRGTVFRTSSVTKNDITLSSIEVLEGKVAVASGGKDVDIPKGFGVVVAGTGNMSEPESLLAAPTSMALAPETVKQNVEVSWPAVNEASHYQFSIATDVLFSNVVYANNVTTTSYVLPTLDEGTYFVRVAPVSKSGLIGFNIQKSTIVNTTPTPPMQLQNISVYRFSGSRLDWTSNSSNSYRVQIASDRHFNNIILDKSTSENKLAISDDLNVGNYYWRVATSSANSILKRGPFSMAAELNIRPVLLSPNLFISVKDEQVTGRWKALKKGLGLEIQTSSESDFKQFNKVITTEAEYVFKPQSTTKFYVRGRLIQTKGGYEGDWSGTCLVNVTKQFAKCDIANLELTN
ncbi:FecR domain-containing protein [Psychrosphaera sp. 1_MG-2023]|uniref:FecR domain-containing protein n=1 Tax=Psychrosphaera sp. 1_MG-2023 TaxID=3062643 RepID=UPI0026E348EF|nr:FecR domain-containing protein [Psychrosphaera sp. 1_MG-2023]MDO6719417.1 FecR domain-containing protein [Psychrosphaera sp. 1_MG-2023]